VAHFNQPLAQDSSGIHVYQKPNYLATLSTTVSPATR
jgi:hypothetical protein